MDDRRHKDLLEAQSLSDRGYYEEAILLLDDLTSTSPPSLEVTFTLGETLMKQGYYNLALEAIDEGLNGELANSDRESIFGATQLLRCCIFAVVTANVAWSLREARNFFDASTLEFDSDHTTVSAKIEDLCSQTFMLRHV
ncbi:hypothetical protein GQ44DRAFT_719740 [Phaeosphaeriaceae sp. PMI808]|nr:hypothetical protein GQ44DRAFT_719740 [Phaeosphaeriaceae sp. PMI808]